MLVIEGYVQNSILVDISRPEDCYQYIRLVHNPPMQRTDEVYEIYKAFPKFIMLNVELVHHLDCFKTYECIGIVERTYQDAINAMQEYKEDYYVVKALICGSMGDITLTLIPLSDVYLSGQPLRYFRYNIIDELLNDL